MATRTPVPPRMSKRGRYVLVLLVGAIALLSMAGWLISLRAEYLWYESVEFTSVFTTMVWTKIILFFAALLAMAAWVGINLFVAWKLRPDTTPYTPEQQGLEKYREFLNPKIGLWIALVAVVVGVFAGMSAQSRWQDWLLFREGGTFGWSDPEFGRDAGFYVFQLPFITFMLSFGFAAIVVGLLAALGAHYLYGAVRMSGDGERMTNAARVHLSVLVALFLLMKAVAYYFDRFAFTTQHNEVTGITGGGYTEMNALMNAKVALIWVSVIAAVVIVVFSWGFTRSLLLPGAALGLVVVTAIAAGGIYPTVVRSVDVEPNRPQREGEYAERTIEGTYFAYGMDTVETEQLRLSGNPNAENLDEDTGTIPFIRLIDPYIVSDAFTQRQQPRGFYDFNQKLDIDRYTYENDEGETITEDFVVGVRELNPDRLTSEQQDWTVRHNVYTHGWGFVSAPTNVNCEGGPYFMSGSMRTSGDDDGSCQDDVDFIEVERPQIYFGLLNNDYAIVGAPDGENPREYDRPTDVEVTIEEEEDEDEAVEEGSDRYTTFQGDTGVDVSSLSRRMLYAWEFQEIRFLLSDMFNENSQLLYHRNVRDRVELAAPFLNVDTDPYPAVVDGQVVWIMAGYTTSADFPYADHVNLAAATEDTYTGNGVAQQPQENINYMRTAVKAVVNAYDGEVTLYEFDENDPILGAWNNIYGGDLVVPKEETPEALEAHFRYPGDHFKVQREMLQRYHVKESRAFIEGSEAWQVPNDPTSGASLKQPPYYVMATYPGQEEPKFQLTSTYTPRNRENAMASMISGWYDNGSPQLTIYDIATGDAESPDQIHRIITSTDQVARDLRLFQQQDQTVEWGNLLALPIGNGIMYMEPMYLRRESAGSAVSLPVLRKVAINYGPYVGYEDTFEDALESVVEQYITGAPPASDDFLDEDFDDEDAAELPDDEDPIDPPPAVDETVYNDPAVQSAMEDVRSAMSDYNSAVSSGDHAAMGQALADLDAALQEFDDAIAAASD
ncbi:UPF0182 family protein [Natronoglycomyces albus]|uniref:UPF0182 family protein n=1 Tax=Natronoglycomyces albus TaxID=2811108 RepID=A0A895XS77_9ACTN|nr:UPF0182 family protein [Natronoglycomyces albus]QSB06065.1 UPF0182 family protein [Natronoglycomyces albus]